MTANRMFLGISVLVWLPYGLWCFANPAFLGGAASVTSLDSTGSTELRAMYGGLQAAIGALSLVALLRPAMERPALIALAFLCAGLGIGRLGGIILDGGVSSYTAVALGFELTFTCLAATLAVRVSTTAEA